MRFAVWCAVSTESQAIPDKASLPYQEEVCKKIGGIKEWTDTGLIYIVTGSRTRWANLRDAEDEIPPLHEMLEDAKAGKYDVLMLYDYNRLRNLMDTVANTLADYGVQVYSTSQPTEPLPVDEFSPYASDSESMMRGMSQIISRSQVNDFRRKFKFGMARRISEKGLTKGTLPFGYRKPPGRETDVNAVPIIDPAKAAIVLKIRDLFLSGQSLWQIADRLTSESIPTPAGHAKWRDVSVRLLLKNRFYCGEVHFGKTRRTTDPRTGKSKSYDNDPSRLVVGKGAHDPLWDKGTQQKIDDEFQRRGKKYTGIRTNRLSNLLYCGICGARVWVQYPGSYAEARRQWYCSVDNKHVTIRDSVLLPRVIEKLTEALMNVKELELPEVEDKRPLLAATLSDLQARHARLTDALEEGSLDAMTYGGRIKVLEKQMGDTKKEIDQAEKKAGKSDERREALEQLASIMEAIPDYFVEEPAQSVNNQLRKILERIVITPEEVSLDFRP